MSEAPVLSAAPHRIGLMLLGVLSAALALWVALNLLLMTSTFVGNSAPLGRSFEAGVFYALFFHDPDAVSLGKDVAFVPLFLYLLYKSFRWARRLLVQHPKS